MGANLLKRSANAKNSTQSLFFASGEAFLLLKSRATNKTEKASEEAKERNDGKKTSASSKGHDHEQKESSRMFLPPQ